MLQISTIKPIIISMMLLLLFSCSATPYQASSWSGGFSDWPLAETNTHVVQFAGNGKTTLKQAQDYALLRSAELCLEQGFQYFYIVENNLEQNKVDVGTGELGGTKIYVTKPTVSMTITLFKTPVKNQLDLYTATDVITQIKSKL